MLTSELKQFGDEVVSAVLEEQGHSLHSGLHGQAQSQSSGGVNPLDPAALFRAVQSLYIGSSLSREQVERAFEAVIGEPIVAAMRPVSSSGYNYCRFGSLINVLKEVDDDWKSLVKTALSQPDKFKLIGNIVAEWLDDNGMRSDLEFVRDYLEDLSNEISAEQEHMKSVGEFYKREWPQYFS